MGTQPHRASRVRVAGRAPACAPLEMGLQVRTALVSRDCRRLLARAGVARLGSGRPSQCARRRSRGDQRGRRRERGSDRRGAACSLRGFRHGRSHSAHQQSGRQSGPGRIHQRRDPSFARAASGYPVVRGSRRCRGFRWLLHCRRRGRDLCEPIQRGRLHRGADEWIRIRRSDRQARGGEASAHRGRTQGPAGPLPARPGRGNRASPIAAQGKCTSNSSRS